MPSMTVDLPLSWPVRWRLLCGEAVRGLHTGGSGSLAVWESTSLSPRVLGFQVGDIGARRVIGP